ncbi:MAG: PIN domain-containing protein [Coriobacteriia bacterium]|nr:PIN domain-containing protein [Coriobacteriia bacterium]
MRVLFDTNVVLDHLLARAPFVDSAERLLSLVDSGGLDGIICSTTVTTIHYLGSQVVGASAATDYVRELLAIFDVACVDREMLRAAVDSGFSDYEDAVLYEAARAAGASAIVTRNGKDFARSTLPVFTPAELLAALRAESG